MEEVEVVNMFKYIAILKELTKTCKRKKSNLIFEIKLISINEVIWTALDYINRLQAFSIW